ncbi:MAG: calcium-binding protein [Microcystis aeruginosa W13-11]|nr:calcium-binding protein [Microcystis aeruginosa W13-11]
MPTVTVSFAGFSSGVTFDRATVTPSVAAFLNNYDIPIYLSGPPIASDNLTSQGFLPSGSLENLTAWRITNVGDADTATLSRYRGGFSQQFSLPANSFTFVRGWAAGTYQLSGGIVNTKASGVERNRIWDLLTTDFYNITGGDGNDTLTGADAADTLIGGNGDDSLLGGADDDTLLGEAGSDILLGGDDDDSLDGGADNDSLFGDAGSDTLLGQAGNDTLLGEAGSDILLGEGGTDSLNGGTGTDTLIGGDGDDTLTGGANVDRLVYNNSSEGVDTITDFNIAQDFIDVSASGFGGGLTAGTLLAAQFLSGAGATSATNANQRFIYNTTNGGLWFDVDGVGGIASVRLATLSNLVVITNNNIVVI